MVARKKEELAIDAVLLAGRLMMQCGAETYRVEDTMRYMAESQQLFEPNSFVTPTGIIFTAGRPSQTKLVSVGDRANDLGKVARVNDVSRKLTSGEWTIDRAYEELVSIDLDPPSFPCYLKAIASAIASASFFILFDGSIGQIGYAALAGGFSYIISEWLEAYSKVRFIGQFLGALFAAVFAYFITSDGATGDLDALIVAGVMPLVPGVLITNAVRDLMSGHFVSGVSKGAEAVLTSFAIGAGVALVLSI